MPMTRPSASRSNPSVEKRMRAERAARAAGVRGRVDRMRRDVSGMQRIASRLGGRRDVLRHVVQWMIDGYRRVNAGDLAAALAFNAMMAIVPTILLMITIAGVLFQSDELYRKAVLTTLWLLPAGLSGESVEAIFSARGRSGIFGLASFAGFVWVGSTFFACLGRTMNAIYGVPDPPPVQQRLRGFFVVVAFAVLFLVAVIAAALPSVFLGLSENDLPFHLHRSILASGAYQVLSYVVAVLTAMLLFGMLFRVVPNARQRVDDILPGALVTATLFVLLVQVFPLYLRITRNLSGVGSTFALLPLLLAWFYLLAHFMLFGAFVNASYQGYRRRRIALRRRRSDQEGASSAVSGERRGQFGRRKAGSG